MVQPSGSDVDVSIVLPTFKRPKGLKAALRSLIDQELSRKKFEIVVVDNDPLESGRKFVENLAQTSSIKITYTPVPSPGVANVRNTGFEIARGRYVAFLDDDQIAAPNWLSVLVETAETFQACVVFTAITSQSDIDVRHKSEILKFFERARPQTGAVEIDDFYGCGSSLIDRGIYDLPSPSFCLSTNETGGEDDLLFSYLRSQGGRMAYTDETYAVEVVEPARMTTPYLRKRSFAYGQGPSRLCAPPNKLNVLGLIKWTVIGLGQFGVYGLCYAAARLAGSPKSIWFMRKTCEGAGKVLWYERFRPKIYGQR